MTGREVCTPSTSELWGLRAMPSRTALSMEDTWDLVEFVRSLAIR